MTSQLWFRLDEILPIAEHAMACPAHRLTPAQIRAGQPLRPALVWGHDNEKDTMYSNGVPTWYDEHGSFHTAVAWTWLHNGARGTAGLWRQAQPRHRFLALDHHDGLITVLRDGAARGGHWVMVDTDPLLPGGQQRFSVLDHRGDIAPADTRWVQANVTAAAAAYGTYPALVADGYSVRGRDVLARFDRPTVEDMVADLNGPPIIDAMPGEYPVLGWDADVLVVFWEQDISTTQIRMVEADRVYPDADGMYAVGAYLWPWITVEHQ